MEMVKGMGAGQFWDLLRLYGWCGAVRCGAVQCDVVCSVLSRQAHHRSWPAQKNRSRGMGDEAWKRGSGMLLAPSVPLRPGPSAAPVAMAAQLVWAEPARIGSALPWGTEGVGAGQAAAGARGGRGAGRGGVSLRERSLSRLHLIGAARDLPALRQPRRARASCGWDRGGQARPGSLGLRRGLRFPGTSRLLPSPPGRPSPGAAAAAPSRLAHALRPPVAAGSGRWPRRLADPAPRKPGRRQGARAQFLGTLLSTRCLPGFPTSCGLLTHITQLGMAISKWCDFPWQCTSVMEFYGMLDGDPGAGEEIHGQKTEGNPWKNEGAVGDASKAFMFSSMNQCCGVSFQSASIPCDKGRVFPRLEKLRIPHYARSLADKYAKLPTSSFLSFWF
ncbi:uncharacterized protein LOC141543924 [Sminthopsis crassicaudata]|uniref:uncharacterized protein LOC141543924 n=1 Tax=Sminthopsis crassicaudata TaxID=9301 RepID=UPI003D680AB8